MTRSLALAAAAAALAGCAPATIEGSTLHQLGHSITPGLVIHCAGRCLIYPANVGNAPVPGERAKTDPSAR